jgi:hypothetical protein
VEALVRKTDGNTSSSSNMRGEEVVQKYLNELKRTQTKLR